MLEGFFGGGVPSFGVTGRGAGDGLGQGGQWMCQRLWTYQPCGYAKASPSSPPAYVCIGGGKSAETLETGVMAKGGIFPRLDGVRLGVLPRSCIVGGDENGRFPPRRFIARW